MSPTTLVFDPQTVRGDFPILGQLVYDERPLIYLDNAASTQRPSQVINAISACYRHTYANVHRGIHWLSERSTEMYERARCNVQEFVGASQPSEIIFTSGTTSAINLVARAWGDMHVQAGDEILLSIMEHHSNIVPWQQLAQRKGAVVRWMPLEDESYLPLDRLDQWLSQRTKIVAMSAVSNVLGTKNPIGELVRRAHDVGAIVVVDAAQHVPHEPTDVVAWNADFVAFSGHKMLGPSGIGVLYGRRELLEAMPPFLGGGSMISSVTTEGFTPGELPAKFEAGTPPIVSAIAFGVAIDYLKRIGMDQLALHERHLAERAYCGLREMKGVRVLGPPPEDRAGIVSFHVEGLNAQDISIFIDQQGVALRAGHHCTMPLHEHLGIPASCRASFYLYNTEEEVDRFLQALQLVIDKLR